MGELVGRHYPTALALKAADHTYVECGTGALGWACWGGKANGAEIRRGVGSTLRAHEIADTDEKAGITCYLVNGVCHQAANRIILPAGITMDGVRGYRLSVAIFGVYGRPRGYFGLCEAPFEQHDDVAGDLPECQSQHSPTLSPAGDPTTVLDFEHQDYLARSRALYFEAKAAAPEPEAVFDYAMQHFDLLVELTLGQSLALRQRQNLRDVRAAFEHSRAMAEKRYAAARQLPAFAKQIDLLTLKLQAGIAEVLDDEAYRRLLDLSRGEVIVISDPAVVSHEPNPPASNGRFQF